MGDISRKTEIEKQWKSNGLLCAVLFQSMGHRCGYVGIPETHPLHGAAYSDHADCLVATFERVKGQEIGKRGIIPLFYNDGKKATPDVVFDVHGGITYAEGNWCVDAYGPRMHDYPAKAKGRVWWFGFDCSHSGDARDLSRMSDEDAKIYGRFNDGVVRSLDYVVAECESLAAQLSEVKQ